MIELRNINKENFNEVVRLKVRLKQKYFICSVEKSLARAYVSRNNVFPFGVYNDNIPVGFVMCRYNAQYNNMFIWQLFIDKSYQNKGYGKAALIKTIEWIEKYDKDLDVVTTVIKGNKSAKKLYERIGFKVLETLGDETDYKLDREFFNKLNNDC